MVWKKINLKVQNSYGLYAPIWAPLFSAMLYYAGFSVVQVLSIVAWVLLILVGLFAINDAQRINKETSREIIRNSIGGIITGLILVIAFPQTTSQSNLVWLFPGVIAICGIFTWIAVKCFS